ncbi:hypothetical protein BAU18_000582 [Enterococcus diestrammenae]|uniref:Phage tail protein n=2 Tax=Enterococcus TaxID=1350 RepID=A0ABV0EYX0_9ENTE
MTSVNFMDPDEPNFIWKGRNALLDMDCIIESELPEISANKRYETYTVIGRSGELHETFDDYESYDYGIEDITIPRERLSDIKLWLSGRSRLITHNDADKYRDCICTMSKPIEFENEWGVFYTFSVTFRSQPFRKKVRDVPKSFAKGSLTFFDPGQEVAKPYFEIQSTGGNITIKIGKRSLTVQNALAAIVTVDCENGKVMQEGLPLFTKGEWPFIYPGKNILTVSGAVTSGQMWNRSVWL